MEYLDREKVVGLLQMYRRLIVQRVPSDPLGEYVRAIDACIKLVERAHADLTLVECRECRFYNLDWNECQHNSRALGSPVQPDGWCYRGDRHATD